MPTVTKVINVKYVEPSVSPAGRNFEKDLRFSVKTQGCYFPIGERLTLADVQDSELVPIENVIPSLLTHEELGSAVSKYLQRNTDDIVIVPAEVASFVYRDVVGRAIVLGYEPKLSLASDVGIAA